MESPTQASRTALMVCAYRARVSRWSRPLFVDPWAAALAGEEGEAHARALDARFPPMETWIALRVAYLDRLVGLAAASLGVAQIVLLGAGYDTRAARLARPGLRFFEVDHPATQADKRARLAQLGDYPADAARLVACDFEREDPVERLLAHGLDARAPALVIWEGVVPYLSEDAVRATATRVATGLHAGSLLAFDFLGKRLVEGRTLGAADQHTRAFVGDLGEPLRFGSNDVLPLLAGCGFRWVRVHDFNELALELLGDYVRERQFRFQYLALASRAVPAGWP
jgi:methyltransferase (TIGR00027 family)